MKKTLLLIVNPRAGRSQSRAGLFDAVHIFSKAGYLVFVHITDHPGDATETAAALGGEFDAVVCAGGDGTLNETVTGLLRLEAPPPLGYLPRGSTNDFAASLHLPTNVVKAAQIVADGRSRTLDIGRWNRREFVYVASFGAFVRSAYAAPQSAKNALGHFAYILEGVKDLNTLRPYQLRLEADGERLDGEYLFGAVCNSTSIGGLMKLEPAQVVLDDGLFEMLLIPSPQNAVDLNNLILALVNQEYDHEGLVFRHVSRIRVESDESVPWSLDGEYAPWEPVIDMENRRQALTFLLP